MVYAYGRPMARGVIQDPCSPRCELEEKPRMKVKHPSKSRESDTRAHVRIRDIKPRKGIRGGRMANPTAAFSNIPGSAITSIEQAVAPPDVGDEVRAMGLNRSTSLG